MRRLAHARGRDRHENFNAQIYGRKRWVLVPPEDSRYVYYTRDGIEQVIFSPVDFARPDTARFPLLAQARRLEFVLDAGEVLYLPPGWWHFVEGLSPAINVNFWWWSLAVLATVARVTTSTARVWLGAKLRGEGDGGRAVSMPVD